MVPDNFYLQPPWDPTRNSVHRTAPAARQWLDEDVVLQALAYSACKDKDFCDLVPYKSFHTCCYTLAMVTDDHQLILSTAAIDCLRVWRLPTQSKFPVIDHLIEPVKPIWAWDPSQGAW